MNVTKQRFFYWYWKFVGDSFWNGHWFFSYISYSCWFLSSKLGSFTKILFFLKNHLVKFLSGKFQTSQNPVGAANYFIFLSMNRPIFIWVWSWPGQTWPIFYFRLFPKINNLSKSPHKEVSSAKVGWSTYTFVYCEQ